MKPEQEINELKKRLSVLETSISINRNLDNQSKDLIGQFVATRIPSVLWDNVSFTSSFATASITTVSPSTAELLDANGRESDTSGGRRFRPERVSKYRATFYINSGLSVSTIYLTAPAVSAASTIGTAMVDANKSYVGVKIIAGVIYMVSSVAGTETTIRTGTTITDATTHLLEIDYYITHAVVKFNNVVIGDISCNLLTTTLTTFFPFLTSVKSSDGTAVNLTIEGFEFLQNRQ